MIKAYLYDSSGRDREINLQKTLGKVSARQLLWIDISGRDKSEITHLGSLLKLSPECLADLTRKEPDYRLNTYGGYLHFDVATLHLKKARKHQFPNNPSSLRLDFLVGKQWLVTVHHDDPEFLEEFRSQNRGETLIGKLTPAALASSLLDWHLTPYLDASEVVEEICDHLDEQILQDRRIATDILPDIVRGQHYVTGLRRLLVPQRSVFYGLSRADVALVTGNASDELKSLEHRFERALDIIEHGREVVRSSFILYSARTGDKTNVLIRRFTFVSVALGVVGAVAGVFGMNFDTPYTHSGLIGFWMVITVLFALIALFGLLSLWRRWI